MKRYALLLALAWASILIGSNLKDSDPNSVWGTYLSLAVFGAPLLTFLLIEFINKKYKNAQANLFVKLNRLVLYCYIAGIALIPIIIGMFIMNMTIYAGVGVNILLFVVNIGFFIPEQKSEL